MNENEKNFETFMKEQDKKKKQTIIWRVFSTVCLVAIILLIIFRTINCNCNCSAKAVESTATQSISSQIPDSTTDEN